MNITSPLHLFAPQKHLFRGYDIRGDCRYFSNDFIHALSAVLIDDFRHHSTHKPLGNHHKKPINTLVKKSVQKIVIGFDVRHGSETIAKQIAYYFSSAGFNVIWLGLVTTPILFYWVEQQKNGCDKNGIIVTASHSAKENTGIKWLKHGQSPTPKIINRYYQCLDMIAYDNYGNCGNKVDTSDNNDSINPLDTVASSHILTPQNIATSWQSFQHTITKITSPVDAYLDSIDDALANVAASNILATEQDTPYLIDTLAIDCLNGATAGFVYRVFSRYVREIHIINDTADPNFTKGCPNPTASGRLTDLQNLVKSVSADVGLAFDGDGDRLVAIDNNGKVLQSDSLLYLLASSINISSDSHHSNAQKNIQKNKVLFDVKCSHHLPSMLYSLNLQPLITETGSNLMRQKMIGRDSDIIFAGELSGHFIFNDGHFMVHDDAMYAGLRLLLWLSQQPEKLSHIHDSLPKTVCTADTYIKTTERESILAFFTTSIQRIVLLNIEESKKHTYTKRTQNLAKIPRITTIDGLRIDTDEGFGLIRLSNTSQSLTIRFSGNTLKDVKKIQQKFVDICLNFNLTLAQQIQSISVS